MNRAARMAVLVVALSLLVSATAAASHDDPWESKSDPKTTCWHTAWPLTVLGVLGLLVILVQRGAVLSRNEIYYRNPWWRISWWAFGLSLLVGVVLVRTYCGGLLAW